MLGQGFGEGVGEAGGSDEEGGMGILPHGRDADATCGSGDYFQVRLFKGVADGDGGVMRLDLGEMVSECFGAVADGFERDIFAWDVVRLEHVGEVGVWVRVVALPEGVFFEGAAVEEDVGVLGGAGHGGEGGGEDGEGAAAVAAEKIEGGGDFGGGLAAEDGIDFLEQVRAAGEECSGGRRGRWRRLFRRGDGGNRRRGNIWRMGRPVHVRRASRRWFRGRDWRRGSRRRRRRCDHRRG